MAPGAAKEEDHCIDGEDDVVDQCLQRQQSVQLLISLCQLYELLQTLQIKGGRLEGKFLPDASQRLQCAPLKVVEDEVVKVPLTLEDKQTAESEDFRDGVSGKGENAWNVANGLEDEKHCLEEEKKEKTAPCVGLMSCRPDSRILKKRKNSRTNDCVVNHAENCQTGKHLCDKEIEEDDHQRFTAITGNAAK